MEISLGERIRVTLTQGLDARRVEVLDESHHHVGHAGHDGKGESHFRVTVVAPAFSGRSRLDRHRMIHALLRPELDGRIHALSIKALAPEEDSPARIAVGR
jgi:BolA protein